MRWLESLLWRMRAFIRQPRMDADRDRELRFHIERHVAELIARGETPEFARDTAARTFGNLSQVQEDCRHVYGFRYLTDLVQDVTYAARTMVRTSGFVVAVLSLALAVGVTAGIYGTADWLLNRSTTAVREPDRLVTMRVTDRERPDFGPFGFGWPQYEALRNVQDGFVDIASFAKLSGVVSNDVRADEVVFEYVTGNYFSMLGVRPFLGRTFTADDDVDGAPPVVMLSQDYWQGHLGGDVGVVERPIRLNGKVARIVGVVPRTFDSYESPWVGPSSIWIPMHAAASLGRTGLLSGNTSFFPIVGRMRPEMNTDLVREKAQGWLRALPFMKMPTWSATEVVVIPSRQMRTGPGGLQRSGGFFLALTLVSAFTLMAACFNIANFLIGRALERRRELALRAAIGASRMRLFRQLLTEALILGIVASLLAVVVTIGVARVLAPLPPVYLNLPLSGSELSTAQAIDSRMVGLAVMIGLASTLIFGLIPALIGSPADPIRALKDPKPHWSWTGFRLSVRQIVLVLQVAMTVALAATAGLHALSFMRAAAVGSGYSNPESVLVARIVATSVSPERRSVLNRALLARLNSMPDVVSASIGWNPPFAVGIGNFEIPDRKDTRVVAMSTAAAPRFFETLGVPIVQGREFDGSEDDLRQGVVINSELARRLWPDGDPIGQRVLYGTVNRRVVGVVAEDRCARLLADAQLCAWQPFPLNSSSGYLRVRTKGRPMAFVPSLRNVVHELEPDVALAQESALDTLIAVQLSSYRLAALAGSGLAIFSIALLTVGCLSLFQSMVKDSRREIAIRMALGATSQGLARRVVLHGVLLTTVGTVVGLVTAHFVALRMTDSLYSVSTAEPMAFIVVPLCVVAVGLTGVAWSALTAARTEPARYLQIE